MRREDQDHCLDCGEHITECLCICEECENLLDDCECDPDLEGYEIDGESDNRRELFDGEEETYRNDEGD